jgi:hypothetical protein
LVYLYPEEKSEKHVGFIITLIESMPTWAGGLGHGKMNIRLLQSHAATKLLYVRGPAEPASHMCWGTR